MAPKPAETKVEAPKQDDDQQEPQKIETVYQKLDGPKIVGEKIDLTQFAPKQGAGAKKKRKRIEKPGQNPQGGNNNQQGGNNQGQETVRKDKARVKVETVTRVRVDKAVTVLETITRAADKETVLRDKVAKVETVLETIIKVVKTVLKDKEAKEETEVDSTEADKAETDLVKNNAC